MSTLRGRIPALLLSALAVTSLSSAAVRAADLPFAAGERPVSLERSTAPRVFGALGWPVQQGPRRYDIYGNALGGYFAALPNPLVVSNGCPKAVEPVYDITGNLAGYEPLVVCR